MVKGPDENKKLRALVSFEYSGKRVDNIPTTNEIEIDDFVLQDYVITGNAENGETITVNETTTKLPFDDLILALFTNTVINGKRMTEVVGPIYPVLLINSIHWQVLRKKEVILELMLYLKLLI